MSAPFKDIGSVIRRLNKHSIPEPNTGCVLWMRMADRRGYGRINIDNTPFLAHRASWMVSRSYVSSEHLICHKCDTPSCINPDHLFVGSRRDNIADMDAKGRRKAARGEKAGRAKLTEKQVLSIFDDTRSNKELGAIYGVLPDHIRLIKQGVTWAWLLRRNNKSEDRHA
jgi:hypothetical protein